MDAKYASTGVLLVLPAYGNGTFHADLGLYFKKNILFYFETKMRVSSRSRKAIDDVFIFFSTFFTQRLFSGRCRDYGTY